MKEVSVLGELKAKYKADTGDDYDKIVKEIAKVGSDHLALLPRRPTPPLSEFPCSSFTVAEVPPCFHSSP